MDDKRLQDLEQGEMEREKRIENRVWKTREFRIENRMRWKEKRGLRRGDWMTKYYRIENRVSWKEKIGLRTWFE